MVVEVPAEVVGDTDEVEVDAVDADTVPSGAKVSPREASGPHATNTTEAISPTDKPQRVLCIDDLMVGCPAGRLHP